MSDVAADVMAAGLVAAGAGPGVSFGTVTSVNADGTVTVVDARGTRPSVRCMKAYTPRAVGDSVLVAVTDAGPVALGAIGAPVASSVSFTLSDSAAPGGSGWEEAVSGQVWAKSNGSLWMKRTVAAPPPTGGTVTQTATTILTYRAGSITQTGRAEQGDYTGAGLQTGLATFGSWAALSGKTATGGSLTIHRRAGGHGFTYGEVAATAYRCVASGAPASPPTLLPDSVLIPAALNETRTAVVSAGWAQAFCDGSATAVGFYSTNANDNIEIDAVTLSITHS